MTTWKRSYVTPGAAEEGAPEIVAQQHEAAFQGTLAAPSRKVANARSQWPLRWDSPY